MDRFLQKRVVIPLTVIAIIAVTVMTLRPSTVDVTTATAAFDTLSVSIPVEGRTRARDLYSVTAPISGRLQRMLVEEGDAVLAGTVLGRMFPAPQDPRTAASARAEVRAAEAGYLNAEARLQEADAMAVQADREIERRRPLAELGALSAEAMEQAELAGRVAHQRSESAAAALVAAEASLDGARARLLGLEAGSPDAQGVDVVSPVDGRVLRMPNVSERVIAAGTSLLELANTGGLEVVLDVLSEDAVRVEPGQELRITVWGGEGTLSGTIRNVTLAGYTKISALGVEEQRVDVIGDLHDFPSTLGTGYRVQGDVIVWHGSGVLSVPTSALFRADGAWQLFVVEAGRAVRRPVTIGNRNEASVEIRDGLAEGEAVILFPSESIADGVRVRAS